MTEKLEPSNKLAYKTYGELFEDFKQIVINCKIFNPPNTEPVWYVEVLDRAWRAEWEKASKMSYTTKRSLGSFLKNLMAEGAYVLSYLVAFLKHIPLTLMLQSVPLPHLGTHRCRGVLPLRSAADPCAATDQPDHRPGAAVLRLHQEGRRARPRHDEEGPRGGQVQLDR